MDPYSGRHKAGLTVRARVIVGVLMALAATMVASAGVGAAGEPPMCTIQTLGTVSGPVNLSAARELQRVLSLSLPSFYRCALRLLGNRADAEDAVQEALLSAHKS